MAGDTTVAVAPDTSPPNFRALRVLRWTDVTPRMRRITLAGEALQRFDAEAMHVKILIPQDDSGPVEPRWPRLGEDGQPDFAGCTLTRRTYTIRRIDAAAGVLDIDFVLHGDASPGSRFALRAAPGDWLGITGPGGSQVSIQGWTLVAGDETALPVIARALEGMAPDSQGQVLIEVADAAERQDLAHPPGMVLQWVPRDGAPYGTALLAAVARVAWPAPLGSGTVSAWAACEGGAAASLRTLWGAEDGLPQGRFRAVAYWHDKGGAPR